MSRYNNVSYYDALVIATNIFQFVHDYITIYNLLNPELQISTNFILMGVNIVKFYILSQVKTCSKNTSWMRIGR